MSGHVVPYVTTRTPTGERTVDLYSRLLDDRIVYLSAPIDTAVATTVIAQLLHLEADDADAPINLYLSSPGGAIAPTLGVYDAMQYVSAPIATTCIGEVGPTATVVLAAGAPSHRRILPHARVVLHQPSNEGSRGAIPDLIVEADEMARLRGQLDGVLARHTGRSVDDVHRDTDRTLVLTARQAVEYGLVDEVVEPRGPWAEGQAASRTG